VTRAIGSPEGVTGRLVEVANCPICDVRGGVIASVPTINPDSNDLVELLACPACGHWWHSPIPDQSTLLALYESASRFVVGPGALESYQGEKSEQPFHRFVFQALPPLLAGVSRYLEIGSGGGHLLRTFRERGYECYGVDPGQWVPDMHVYSSLDSLPVRSFNVFVLQDVLEHVANPIEMLREIRSFAASQALIFASFPCSESGPARRYGAKWNMVLPYGHVNYFSRESARQLFIRAGWTPEEVQLSRQQSLRESIRRGEWRSLAYEVIKGGKDQLYVSARV
jgi:hypothetical protein